MAITTATLAGQPFLKGLATPHLQVLVDDAMPAEFKAGETVFQEGAPANRFYLILNGKVELRSPTDSEDAAIPIDVIEAGGVLGWSWLFPPYSWHFDARAVTPVKAIFFYGTRLREQCEADHELGYEMMKRVSAVVVERLQTTRRRLAEQAKPLLLPI
ncbi:MAG TPA: Crp/Fnr family transcriptional regulator [Verrucomicrobiae bacterium]|nr:Crp/Fnr family transcriptional regulator [Verrucomicrobiae bacterium]